MWQTLERLEITALDYNLSRFYSIKRKNFEHAIVEFEYSDATKVFRFVKHFYKVKTRFFFTCELKQ